MKASILNKSLPYILSVMFLAAVWETGARIADAPLIFPLPEDVVRSLFRLCRMPVFWESIGATFARTIVSFAISVVLGTMIGTCAGLSVFWRKFLSFPVAVIRATPVVSFILLALFWFTSSQVPVFVSVLMAVPVMSASVTRGFAEADGKLKAMAVVYGFKRMQVFRWILVPSVVPFLMSGAVSAFGLTWKVVAAGEVLSLPARGAGTLLQTAQAHLETADVAAITTVLVVLSFSVEKTFAFFAGRMHR